MGYGVKYYFFLISEIRFLSYPIKNSRNIREKINDLHNVEMEDEKEKYILTGMIVNHMKKCYIAWSKSSIDDQIILKHLEKLSEGKLKLHKDFKIIEDSKATSKKTSNSKKSNHRNNKRKRY